MSHHPREEGETNGFALFPYFGYRQKATVIYVAAHTPTAHAGIFFSA